MLKSNEALYPSALAGPVAAILLAMVSIQAGASLAKSLFPVMGPVGGTTLRLIIAALLLAAVYRPWRGRSLRGSWPATVGYGLSLGFMNLFYYLALERVPMGVVVAIEFLGPLGVAIAVSRRTVDFAWIALAVLGLLLLLPVAPGAAALDPLGLVFALLAGLGWALYIVFGTRAGSDHGGRSVAIGMIVGAVAITPVGAAVSGAALFAWQWLPLALVVAILSSALPYTLEMYAMTRMPTRVFGVFMSVEPAIAALVGLVVLGEVLAPGQWVAIGCVMLASFGSALTARRS